MRKRSSRRMTGERENSVDEKTRSSSEANLNELFATSSPIRQHSHIAAISSGRICASALTIRYDTLFLLLSVNGRFAKPFCPRGKEGQPARSEEHTSELQSLMRIPYADFGLK